MTGVYTCDTMELTTATIALFKDLVYSRCHLSFPLSREAQLRRWLAQCAEDGGHRSFEEYYQVLYRDSREFDRLISLITTRETYFFRMPAHFQILRETVLPELINREGAACMRSLSQGKQLRMRLRAWSAGCATGQETYSLAMQVLDSIRYAKAWDIEVLGTDINADVLELARVGRYDRLRMGKTPVEFMERYFIPCPDAGEEVLVSDEVKALTRFQALNLRNLSETDSFKNLFDIIFCRNVMIYFDLPAQQRLVEALTACLKPGGYLFTGEGEVLHLYRHSLKLIEQEQSMFYKKPEE